MKLQLMLLLAVSAIAEAASGYKAGVAKVDITPEGPIWLSGYGNRNKPSEGVNTRIFAKALAIEDAKGGRVVIVTTDLIGLPGVVTDAVSARLLKEHKLERPQVLFNSSHTHTGPMVWGNLHTMFALSASDEQVLKDYTEKLKEHLFNAAAAALGDMQPAKLAYGTGEAGFAINRRKATGNGVIISVDPKGPVDHTVPVLRVTSADGKLKAALIAYACHNTTLTGEFYQISGDYAGYMQQEFEKAHPGATAMFLMLCGGDQNPNPRSKLELASEHGRTLANAASKVVDGKMTELKGPVRTAYKMTELTFKQHDRAQFEKELSDKNQAAVRRAQFMLKLYDERRPMVRTGYPVQAVRFGKQATIVALGGEVVIDYNLRIKREYPKEPTVVAGYSNDVMCYIPSVRVLKEGGYEADTSMIYYGKPGPFDETVEEKIMTAVKDVMKRVGR